MTSGYDAVHIDTLPQDTKYVIPGKYAVVETFEGRSRIFTFQTFEEMLEFLREDDEDRP